MYAYDLKTLYVNSFLKYVDKISMEDELGYTHLTINYLLDKRFLKIKKVEALQFVLDKASEKRLINPSIIQDIDINFYRIKSRYYINNDYLFEFFIRNGIIISVEEFEKVVQL